MATYTFTVHSGVGTVTDAAVTVDGTRFDVDAALAAGSGGGTPGTSFKVTDENLVAALRGLRAGSGPLLDVNGTPDPNPPTVPARYAVTVDPTGGGTGTVPTKQADGTYSLVAPSSEGGGVQTVNGEEPDEDGNVEVGDGNAKPYRNLKVSALGTSVTFGGQYTEPLAEMLACAELQNLGEAGASLYRPPESPDGGITSHLDEVDEDAALILLEAGYNDFRSNCPLGTIADTSHTVSFYGALHNALDALATDYPDADVALITPYGNAEGDSGSTGNWLTPNAVDGGHTLEEYRLAIHRVGSKFGVDVITAGEHAQVGGPYAPATLSDSVHPNTDGGIKLASFIAGWLNGTTARREIGAAPPEDEPAGTTYAVQSWSSSSNIIFSVSPETNLPTVEVGSFVEILAATGWTAGSYEISTVFDSFNFDGNTRRGYQLIGAPSVAGGTTGGSAVVPD